MISFAKLIRLPNLIVIAITQYLMRFAIIDSILQFYNNNSPEELSFSLQLSNIDFFILVLSTVCLSAAGYVINDYFDNKTDRLNRPDTVIVGNFISRRSAMTLHVILNIVGIAGGLYVSWVVGHIKFGFIFFLVAGILWYYSTTYKRQFIIGNLIVAILTAMVPLMVVLFEVPMLNQSYSYLMAQYKQDFSALFYWVSAFAFFAFITTLIYEIIKDLEDFEGDTIYGHNTFPVVLGVVYTKIIVVVLFVTTLASMAYISIKFLSKSQISLWYLAITELVPILFLIFKIIVANKKYDYTLSLHVMNLVIVFGLAYSIVAAYIFQNM